MGRATGLGGKTGESIQPLPHSGAPRRGRAQVSEAMARLGTKVHGQIVLQGQVDGGKLVVDPHVRQRRHIGCGDGTHVEGEVVEDGPDRRQGEGRVHKGIGGDRWLVQVLRDGSGQGFDSLDFLWRLLQGGPDAFEGVLSVLSLLFLFGLLLDFLN